MKRTAAALALLVTAMTASPALAVTSTGAVKLGWTIGSSFTAHIATNYKTAQTSLITGTPTILTSGTAGSGTCGTSTGDTATTYTLSYGTIAPGTGATGCDYQNAIAISVNTNDSLGYKIYESLDVTAAPNYYGVCVNPIGSTTAAVASTPASAATAPGSATFTGNVATACAAGTLMGPAQSAVTSPGVYGDVALTGIEGAATLPTTPVYSVASGVPAAGTNYFGEDVQLNVSATAPSGAATGGVILYFVPG